MSIMAACVLVEAMIPRRDEITNPKSRICPNCSSPEQNSNFCTDCGAEVVPAVPVFDKIVSLLFGTIAGLIGIAIGIAAIILGLLLTVAPLIMLVFMPILQGNDGLFPWQRGPDTKDRLNEIYEECKDESSSLSLIFFNINTDQNRMHQCLEKTATSYFGFKDYQIIAFDIPIEFKKILLESKGSNYTDALKESEVREAEATKTMQGAALLSAKYYLACAKDTSLITWGPIMFRPNEGKARECFIERHGDKFGGFSVRGIRAMDISNSWFYRVEEIKDILIYINRPDNERLHKEKKKALTASKPANESKMAQKCPKGFDLSTYPDALEVTDFTESNYGGVYQLDGTYNCSPKWTNFNCGKHGDGTDIRCYLFLSPDKAATKSGTWVVQPLPPSIEWQAGGYFNCPGMPWESCSPGWIGGKSVMIKK